MKIILILALVFTAFSSTSFAFFSKAPKKETFKFTYEDLNTGKVLLVKNIEATSTEEAIDIGAQECFRELRARKMDGIEAIDICVNPRT